MMQQFWCLGCGEELNEPGAILFSPPNMLGARVEFHLCLNCYKPLSKNWGDKRMQLAIDERKK